MQVDIYGNSHWWFLLLAFKNGKCVTQLRLAVNTVSHVIILLPSYNNHNKNKKKKKKNKNIYNAPYI